MLVEKVCLQHIMCDCREHVSRKTKPVYYTVACESLGTPCRICENVNNFNKIREIIQNACYFLFSTVLNKIFYIKYVYI